MAVPGLMPIQPPDNGVYQGAFVPDETVPGEERATRNSIENFEKQAGTSLDIVLKFISFKDLDHFLAFPAHEAKLASKNGGTIFIKLEPWSYGGKNDQSYKLEDIASGKYDHLLQRFGRAAARFGKPIFVTFGHEMNGDWYPWGKQPDRYVEAYQHVHDVINREAPNVTWVWNPNIYSDGSGPEPAEAYYPGSDYADWIALDGYNWGGNSTTEEIFGKNLDEFSLLYPEKPLMIGEFGCAKDNPKCLTDFVNFVADPKNNLRAFVYFHVDKEEKWAIKTEQEREAYSTAVRKHEELFRSKIVAEVPLPGIEKLKGVLPQDRFNPEPPPFQSNRKITLADPDPELGWQNPALRNKLSPRLVTRQRDPMEMNILGLQESAPTLEQMGDVLQGVAEYRPRTLEKSFKTSNPEELCDKYPELRAVYENDLRHDYKFWRYFRDFHEYWNNATVLLSAYVQRCLEEGRLDLLPRALEWAEKIHSHIEAQATVESEPSGEFYLKEKMSAREHAVAEYTPETGIRENPSLFNLALLHITEAEIRSQIPGKDEAFYQAGIARAHLGIKYLLSLPRQYIRPSDPEYLTIARGVLVIGDLYQQMAYLTFNDRHYEKAQRIYADLSAVECSDKNKKPRGFHLNLDKSEGFQKKVACGEIESALEHSVRLGIIDRQEKKEAEIGISLYIAGAALLKEVAHFLSLPGARDYFTIFILLAKLAGGFKKIKSAADLTGKALEQNAYFEHLNRLLSGELLLVLADKIEKEPSLLIPKKAREAVSEQIRSFAKNCLAGVPSKLMELYVRARCDQMDLEIKALSKKINRGEAGLAEAESLIKSCVAEESALAAYGTYRDRVIAALALFTRAAIEERNQFKLMTALDLAQRIRDEFKLIEADKNMDACTRRKSLPSEYRRAALYLTLGEIHSQLDAREDAFYLKGIEFSKEGVRRMFALPAEEGWEPASPDYGSIINGMNIMADTYSRLGSYTHDDRYFEAAQALYRDIEDLRQGIRPLSAPQEINPAAITAALDHGIRLGNLYPAEKADALAFIFHYQKGVALIKAAAQFIGWTKLDTPKTIPAILEQFKSLKEGKAEIELATRLTETDPEKNRFIFEHITLLEGELLLAAAERINFYFEKGEMISPSNLDLAGLSEDPALAWEDLFVIVSPEFLPPVEISKEELIDALIAAAESRFEAVLKQEKGKKERFQFLYVSARMKLLSLKVRKAQHILKVGKNGAVINESENVPFMLAADTTPLLEEAEEIRNELARLPSTERPTYAQVELDFLRASLLLCGIPKKEGEKFTFNKQGRISADFFPSPVFNLLNQEILPDSRELSASARWYFEHVGQIRTAEAELQTAKGSIADGAKIIGKAKEKEERERGKKLMDAGKASIEKVLSDLMTLERETEATHPSFYASAEALALDIHNYKADLYQQIAIAYFILEETPMKIDSRQRAEYIKWKEEYAQKACDEAARSSLPYNQKDRPDFILEQTQVGCDEER